MTANRNGDEFIAAKLREALSGYVGQRLDPTTLESVRDRVIENLPGRFAGTTVNVKQDAADPTKTVATGHCRTVTTNWGSAPDLSLCRAPRA